MLELVTVGIILLPLVSVLLLLVSTSDNLRRCWLMLTGLFLFSVLAWSLMINWSLYLTGTSLFQGLLAIALRFFFAGVWPAAIYALIIAALGYLANRAALRRIAHNKMN